MSAFTFRPIDVLCPTRPTRRVPGEASRWPGRTARMVALVSVIVVVSLIDLYLTLLYLKHGGMGESNPIARWVMGMNCEWVLGVWKFVLVGGACGILLWARKRWTAEAAAWFCAVVMVWLGARWIKYIEIAEQTAPSIAAMSDLHAENWVEFN